jgi:hypothetical protein
VKTTLETSGEDGTPFLSFCRDQCFQFGLKKRRVLTGVDVLNKMGDGRETTLETSGEDGKIHSKRVEKM